MTNRTVGPIGRRALLLGAAAAATAPYRVRAAGRTEITFASAKFYGKQTVAEIVDIYNQSQSRVHVAYIELPPPSSSTEVHQALVQQLVRKSGTPDVFTQAAGVPRAWAATSTASTPRARTARPRSTS